MLALLGSSPAALVTVAVVLGLIVGSFLNVVIARLPVMLDRQWRVECTELLASNENSAASDSQPGASAVPANGETFNLATPRSRCPGCSAPIHAWQNIPLLSYLVLRGRCAHCNVRIGLRYPLIEFLTGILTGLVAWKFGFSPSAGCAAVMTWFLIALAAIDIDHQLLPDSLTLPLLWLGLLASLSTWSDLGYSVPVDPRSAIGGAIVGYLCLWAVFQAFRLLTGKEGMGYGDFKLLAALGAWLGWKMLLPIVLLAAIVGALVGIAQIATGRRHRAQPIPFGPFLAAAGWLALMWGPELVTRYLGLYNPIH